MVRPLAQRPPGYGCGDHASQNNRRQSRIPGTRTAHRSRLSGGFLHHITQLSGHQKASLARHHIDLYFQGVSSHAGPGKSSHNSYLILVVGVLILDLLAAQVFFQVLLCDADNLSRLFVGCLLPVSPSQLFRSAGLFGLSSSRGSIRVTGRFPCRLLLSLLPGFWFILSSRISLAAFRQMSPMRRSRLRTPASLV